MRYVVVLPAKNEEENIRAAIESIVNQSISPVHVIVIDDGSTDGTSAIVTSLEQEFSNVSHHRMTSENEYKLGGHVVRLFIEGKRQIDSMDLEYDWIIKMDADLQCAPDFMEQIKAKIADRKMGIVSGTPYFEHDGKKTYDTSPEWHTHGQFKIYNAECFNEVGGPREHLGWDCADNVRAISAGWECEAIRDVNYLMHREVGGKSSNRQGRANHGIGCYICGVGPGYFSLKVLHDLLKPPYLVGSLGLIRGYFGAAIRREPKVLTKSQRKLIRRLFWGSLFTRFKNRDFVVQQKLLARKDSA